MTLHTQYLGLLTLVFWDILTQNSYYTITLLCWDILTQYACYKITLVFWDILTQKLTFGSVVYEFDFNIKLLMVDNIHERHTNLYCSMSYCCRVMLMNVSLF